MVIALRIPIFEVTCKLDENRTKKSGARDIVVVKSATPTVAKVKRIESSVE